MKSNPRYLLFTSLIVSFLLMDAMACGNSNSQTEVTSSPVKELVFNKLIGTWQVDDGKSFERWSKKNDGTFQSVAFSVKGTDTSWNEQANVYPENNNWVFENTVKDQNNGKAVKFTSIIINANSVPFSNPVHDFPTDVNYTVVDKNTVHAFIIGPNEKGGRDTISFNYKRIK